MFGLFFQELQRSGNYFFDMKTRFEGFLEKQVFSVLYPNSLCALSRLPLSKEASQNEYASCCKEVNFLKARRGWKHLPSFPSLQKLGVQAVDTWGHPTEV